MEQCNGMQHAIDYLESHLTEKTNFAEAARHAAYSEGYFQRIFSLIFGFSPAEYVRNRRLTLAGSELRATDTKVIDVALKYGYESPESFARAFAKFHGISPSAAKRRDAVLKSFSRLSVEITMHGGFWMDYQIIEKESFCILEKIAYFSTENDENAVTIPQFWTRSHTDGTIGTLKTAATAPQLLGVCYAAESADCATFPYSIAVVCDPTTPVPTGFRKTTIPPHTWAIFPCRGAMPHAIQALWREIVTGFFPTSGYRPAGKLDIEIYGSGDMGSADYRSEIWIPVEKTAMGKGK